MLSFKYMDVTELDTLSVILYIVMYMFQKTQCHISEVLASFLFKNAVMYVFYLPIYT